MINIDELIVGAMKAHKKQDALVYKQIKTRIMEFKTGEKDEKTGLYPVYTEEAEKKLLNAMVKELEKDVEAYENIGTPKALDNATEAAYQKAVIMNLLPKPATDEEIIEGINDWVVKYGKIEPKQMGVVINHVHVGHPTARKQDIARLVKKLMSNK